LTVTHARSEVITFAASLVDVAHALFIKNPNDIPNYQAYTQSFKWQVWVAIAILISVAAPSLYLIMK